MALASAEPTASPRQLTGARDRLASPWLMTKATNPQPVDIPRHAQREVTILHQLRKWVPWSAEVRARQETTTDE